jgi:hypothetical protein
VRNNKPKVEIKETSAFASLVEDYEKSKKRAKFLYISGGILVVLSVFSFLLFGPITVPVFSELGGKIWRKEEVVLGEKDKYEEKIEEIEEEQDGEEVVEQEIEEEQEEKQVNPTTTSTQPNRVVEPKPEPKPEPEEEEEVVVCTDQELADINTEINKYNDLIENSVYLKEEEEMEVCATKFSNCAAICYDRWEEGAKLEECYDDCETTVLTPCEDNMDIKYQNLTTDWYSILNDLDILKQTCLATR